jgi:hypothetical protein
MLRLAFERSFELPIFAGPFNDRTPIGPAREDALARARLLTPDLPILIRSRISVDLAQPI